MYTDLISQVRKSYFIKLIDFSTQNYIILESITYYNYYIIIQTQLTSDSHDKKHYKRNLYRD